MIPTDWDSALDALELQLDRQTAAVRRGGAVPRDIELEPPNAPATAQQRLRALALLDRHQDLLDDAVNIMTRRRGRRSPVYR